MALAVAIALASAWASGWQRYTWGARLGTFGCALVVLGIGLLWRRGAAAPGSPGGDLGSPLPAVSRTGGALWLGIVVVAAVWDVLGLLTPPDRHHLTLSAMELAYRPLHAVMFACWLAIGWVLANEPIRRHRRS